MGLEDIFGGSEQVNTLIKPQRQIIGAFADEIIPQIGQGIDTYGGPIVPERDPFMQSAYGMMPGVTGLDPRFNSALGSALSGAGDPNAVRGMYEEALGPAQLEFQRALNEVSSRYGDVQGHAGGLLDMQGRATAEYGMGLNQLLGQLTYGDQQAAAQRQLQALGAGLGAEQQQLQDVGALYGMGESNRQVTGQEYGADYAQWLAEQPYNNPWLGYAQPVLGTAASGIAQDTGLLPGLTNLFTGIKDSGSLL